jgi:predicted transcriptional regulator
MTTKEKMLRAVRDLPSNASVEDAMERLFFLAKIEKGLRQADAGKTITHQLVKEKMAKWLR